MIAPICGKKLLIIVNVLKLPHMFTMKERRGYGNGRAYSVSVFFCP